MQRRTALKQLGLLAGAVILLPHCNGKKAVKQGALSLHNLKITGNQEDALAALVDALIPKTDLPGAHELNVPQFVWRMVDDCTDEVNQQKFLSGLDQIRAIADQKFGKALENCSQSDLQMLLKDLEANKITPQDNVNHIQDFYKPFRSYTIRGFLGSEPIMTNVFGYNMIPGRFTGVVEINASSDLKTILG